jgi:hypothetical protein
MSFFIIFRYYIKSGFLPSTTVILATWEAEIRRITVQGQPRQKVLVNLSPKINRAKWTVSVAQVVECMFEQSPEFKPQYPPHKKVGS